MTTKVAARALISSAYRRSPARLSLVVEPTAVGSNPLVANDIGHYLFFSITQNPATSDGVFKCGRDYWIRTNGILLPKQALYQAELSPDALREVNINEKNIFARTFFKILHNFISSPLNLLIINHFSPKNYPLYNFSIPHPPLPSCAKSVKKNSFLIPRR